MFRVLRGDVERPLVSLGWRTVPALHDDTPALDLAAGILGAGRGSRLYRHLRAPGLAARATGSHYTPTEVGVFDIDIEADADRVEPAIERALALVQHLAEGEPTEPELRRARGLLLTGWSRRMESMDGRATALCEAEALGDYRLVDLLAERTLAVSADEVRAVVEQWLDTSVTCGVVYLPRTSAPLSLERRWPPSPEPSAGEEAPASTAALPSDGTAEPLERRDLPDGLVHWRFPGVDVLARPKRGSGSVTLLLHFPGLPLAETSATAGLSWLLARTAIRGAGGLVGKALAVAAESLGGTLAPAVGAQTFGWSLTVAPSSLPQAAALLRSVGREPHLDGEDVSVERSLQASDARRQRDDMFRYPLQRVLELAFPEHPYGLPGLGVPEAVVEFGRDLVRGWGERVRSIRPVAVVVGDVDERDLLWCRHDHGARVRLRIKPRSL